MKILSYNINRFTQEKLDKILQFNADVYILPEIACTAQVRLPEGFRMEWMGNYEFKGLGIVWKSVSLFVEFVFDAKLRKFQFLTKYFP